MKIDSLSAAAGLLAAAVLCLTGCGGSGTTTATSGGGPGSGGGVPAGTSAPAAPAPGGGKSVDVCSALPLAAAAQITGTKFAKTKTNNVEGVVFGCEYSGPGGSLLQISVETQNGPLAFDADVKALKTVGFAPTKVTGVGDEAFSEPSPKTAGAQGAAGFASYGAVFGETYIKIGGLTYVDANEGKQIVEELHSKI